MGDRAIEALKPDLPSPRGIRDLLRVPPEELDAWLEEPTETECGNCGRMFLSRGEKLSGRCKGCIEAYRKAAHQKKHGENLRKPAYGCPYCSGTGWEILEDKGVGSARRCRCTIPTDEQSIDYWLDRAGVPQKYFLKSLSGWKGRQPQEVSEFLLDPSRHRTLFVSGLQGRGKTHLATAVLRELFKLGMRGFWRDVKQWCATLRRLVGEKDRVQYDFETIGLRTAEVVLLDDFGRERTTDFAADELELLVRERHSRELITLVTSQWTLEELVQPPPRGRGVSADICSRLSEGLRVRLDGKDWRRG